MRRGPSWYLDPLVAEQKRHVFRTWILDSAGTCNPAVVLKTDLFEEAYNRDQILWDLFPAARLGIGVDVDPWTAARASARNPGGNAACLIADVRGLPLPAECVDLIVSTSTLDHFEDVAELQTAIAELARVLRPGGKLFLVLDNPCNPLYPLLRWVSRRGWTPFVLGRTLPGPAIARQLEAAGLQVREIEGLIHNPRLVSTVWFLILRRVFGRHADRPIRFLLALFEIMGRLPTRRFTACFLAAVATKPASVEGSGSGV